MIQATMSIIVGILGGGAIAFMACRSRKRRLVGYILGLLSEPAWIWMSIDAGQWGVVPLCVWWGVFYAIGTWRHRRDEHDDA